MYDALTKDTKNLMQMPQKKVLGSSESNVWFYNELLFLN